MDKNKLNHFKKILLEDRAEIIEDLELSNNSFSEINKHNTGDLVDQATKFYEKELSIRITSTEKETLNAIDKALAKIQNNTFGSCETCKQKIDDKRLEALPYATLCMSCKQGITKGITSKTKQK